MFDGVLQFYFNNGHAQQLQITRTVNCSMRHFVWVYSSMGEYPKKKNSRSLGRAKDHGLPVGTDDMQMPEATLRRIFE